MATDTWKNAVSGDWTNAADWSTGAVPAATDDAVINLAGSYTVSVTSADSAQSLTLNSAGAELAETGFFGALSLAGALTVDNGLAVLDDPNTVSGGVTLNGGEIDVGNNAALGAGTLTVAGGKLLGTVNETLPNTLHLSGSFTIAAAHGTPLTIGGSSWNLQEAPGNTISIGAPGQDGTVLWSTPSFSGVSNFGTDDLVVQAGTLASAPTSNSGLSFLLGNMRTNTVASGAVIDLTGFSSQITGLQGSGTVTDSGAAVTLNLSGPTNFAGTLNGALALLLFGNSTLSGTEDFTGATSMESGTSLTVGGTFDLTNDAGVFGNNTTSLIDNGLFEKTGGAGVSTISAPFVNDGQVVVASGSVQFAGGFTNNGTVQGVLSESGGVWTVSAGAANAAPPAGTTADMMLRNGGDGGYEIYDIGNNAILSAASLALFGPEWQVAGLGGFSGTDTSDMLMRNGATGAFQVYDVSNNNITGSAAVGQVGPDWQVAGFGDFSGNANETDMLMRNSNTGAFEIYDIGNNAIKSAAPMGQVGLEWSIAGFGDFSTRAGETDMLLRNSNTGAFELYDIANNQLTSAVPMGQVGLEWSVAGFGDFSGNADETDMLMRNSNTGQFEIYDIRNNAIVSAAAMGQVGLEWQVVGFGPLDGAGSSDMLMRNSNTGAFEVYDIAHNQLTTAAAMGQVGLEWQVAGIAADPPSGAAPAQIAQAMASFAPAGSAPSPSLSLDPTAQPTAANLFASTTGVPRPA